MNLLKVALLGTALSLLSTEVVVAFSSIVHKNLVSEEDEEYLNDKQYVPVRKFVAEIKQKDGEELEKVDILSLEGSTLRSSGMRVIMNEVLPLLPHLRILNISYTSLDKPEDAGLIIEILKRFPHLEFLHVLGNGVLAHLSTNLVSQVKTDEQLLSAVTSKVVIFHSGMASGKFKTPELNPYTNWEQTHRRFYQVWDKLESNFPDLLAY